jgi:hypothetical protein
LDKDKKYNYEIYMQASKKESNRPKKVQKIKPEKKQDEQKSEPMSLEDFTLDTIYFVKTKTSIAKHINHYLVLHKSKKISFMLKNIKLPFGYETFNNHTILNIEINPKKNNYHYNMYVLLSGIEKTIQDLQTTEKISSGLKNDIDGKGYYPNMRESKEGYIVRSYVMCPPKIYAKIGTYEMSLTPADIKNTIANVIIELGIIWITDHNYGILWALKEIHVVSSQ